MMNIGKTDKMWRLTGYSRISDLADRKDLKGVHSDFRVVDFELTISGIDYDLYAVDCGTK